jgi:hypothetical protein
MDEERKEMENLRRGSTVKRQVSTNSRERSVSKKN